MYMQILKKSLFVTLGCTYIELLFVGFYVLGRLTTWSFTAWTQVATLNKEIHCCDYYLAFMLPFFLTYVF